jgi:hypothetical protein
MKSMFKRTKFNACHVRAYKIRGLRYVPTYSRYTPREINAAAAWLAIRNSPRPPVQLWWFSALRDMVLKVETNTLEDPQFDPVASTALDLLTIQPWDHLTCICEMLGVKPTARLARVNTRMRSYVRAYANANQGKFMFAIYHTYEDVPVWLRTQLAHALRVMYPHSSYAPEYHGVLHHGASQCLRELNMGSALLTHRIKLPNLQKLKCCGENLPLIEAAPIELHAVTRGGLLWVTEWPLVRFEADYVMNQSELDTVDCMRRLKLAVIFTMGATIEGEQITEAENVINAREERAIRAATDAAESAVRDILPGTLQRQTTYMSTLTSALREYQEANPCEYFRSQHPAHNSRMLRRMRLPDVPMHLLVDTMDEVMSLRRVVKLSLLQRVYSMVYHEGWFSDRNIESLICYSGNSHSIFPRGMTHLRTSDSIDRMTTAVTCVAYNVHAGFMGAIRDLTISYPRARVTDEYLQLRALRTASNIPRDAFDRLISSNLRVLHTRDLHVSDDDAMRFDELQVANHDNVTCWKRMH